MKPIDAVATVSVADETIFEKKGEDRFHIVRSLGPSAKASFLDKSKIKFDGFSAMAIYDGHGSANFSEYLSSNLDLKQFYNSQTKNIVDDQTITNAFITIDKKMYNREFRKLGGSTGSLVLVSNNEIVVAYVGDSRVLVSIESEKKIYTLDHNLFDVKERIRVSERGGTIALEFSPEKLRDVKKKYENDFRTLSMLTSENGIGTFYGHSYIIIQNVNIAKIDSDSAERSASILTTDSNQKKAIEFLENEGVKFTARIIGDVRAVNMTRAFGDFDLKVSSQQRDAPYAEDGIMSVIPTIIRTKIPNENGKRIHVVVASDGFWNFVPSSTKVEEIIHKNRKVSNLYNLLNALVKGIIGKKEKDDDTTIVVGKFITKKAI